MGLEKGPCQGTVRWASLQVTLSICLPNLALDAPRQRPDPSSSTARALPGRPTWTRILMQKATSLLHVPSPVSS